MAGAGVPWGAALRQPLLTPPRRTAGWAGLGWARRDAAKPGLLRYLRAVQLLFWEGEGAGAGVGILLAAHNCRSEKQTLSPKYN